MTDEEKEAANNARMDAQGSRVDHPLGAQIAGCLVLIFEYGAIPLVAFLFLCLLFAFVSGSWTPPELDDAMKKFTIFFFTLTILACGVMPLPKAEPAVFDYHPLLSPYPRLVIATSTPAPSVEESGRKVREWMP